MEIKQCNRLLSNTCQLAVHSLVWPLENVLARRNVNSHLKVSALSVVSVVCETCPSALYPHLRILTDWVLNILEFEKTAEIRRGKRKAQYQERECKYMIIDTVISSSGRCGHPFALPWPCWWCIVSISSRKSEAHIQDSQVYWRDGYRRVDKTSSTDSFEWSGCHYASRDIQSIINLYSHLSFRIYNVFKMGLV